MSHGEVTNYRLFVDEQEVYYGLNKRTEVDGLLPYKFVLIMLKIPEFVKPSNLNYVLNKL